MSGEREAETGLGVKIKRNGGKRSKSVCRSVCACAHVQGWAPGLPCSSALSSSSLANFGWAQGR